VRDAGGEHRVCGSGRVSRGEGAEVAAGLGEQGVRRGGGAGWCRWAWRGKCAGSKIGGGAERGAGIAMGWLNGECRGVVKRGREPRCGKVVWVPGGVRRGAGAGGGAAGMR
jgi:hypothetical protein